MTHNTTDQKTGLPQARYGQAAALSTRLLPLGALMSGLLAHPALAETEATLPRVQVQADQEFDSTPNGLQGAPTRVGKVQQLPKDVPQALTVISDQLMQERNADTLKAALSNVAGLTFNAGEGGRIGDNMNLRGFYSFGDLYLDGIRDVAQYNRDPFNQEQVEVLRGSGSMLFGRGQAGGVINQASKMPALINQHSVAATLGTQDYQRYTADLNQRLGETTALRLNLMRTDAGSTRDHVSSERTGVAPTLGLGLGTDNEVMLSYFFLDTHNVPDYGVPFFEQKPLDVGKERFYGTTSDYEDNVVNMATATWRKRPAVGTDWRTTLRWAHYERDLWVTQPQLRPAPIGADGKCPQSQMPVSEVNDDTCINRSIKARGGEEQTLTLQSDYNTTFNTGNLRHEALVGIELLKEDADRWSYSTDGLNIPGTTVGNPDPSPAGLDPLYGHQTPSNPFAYEGKSVGIYLQDTVEFLPGWKLMAGLRYDHMSAEYQGPQPNSYGNSSSAELQFDEVSYRTGLMYQPNDRHTYYLAWNDSFNPTADLYQLDFGTGFPAERSSTTEIGGKWELFQGDLSLRSAVYRANKEYERNTDLNSAGGLLSRKRHTDGFELEAAGRITANWEVFAGWALMRATIDEQHAGDYLGTFAEVSGGNYAPNQAQYADQAVYANHYNPYTEGMRARNSPAYSFNLWSTWRVASHWKVGVGLEGKGDRLAYGVRACDSASQNPMGQWTYNACSAPVPNVAPSYTRWDAMVSYDQRKYRLQLNVLNLTDSTWYESVYDNGGHVVPGTGRAVQLTGEYRF